MRTGRKAPEPRAASRAPRLGETWIESEELAYPSGGFLRRGYVRLRQNPHNPIALAYGTLRLVRLSVPDTFFSVPAKLRWRGRTVDGFVSVVDDEYRFTPEAAGAPLNAPPSLVAARVEARLAESRRTERERARMRGKKRADARDPRRALFPDEDVILGVSEEVDREFARLLEPYVVDVWNAIGADVLAYAGETDNESLVESCTEQLAEYGGGRGGRKEERAEGARAAAFYARAYARNGRRALETLARYVRLGR